MDRIIKGTIVDIHQRRFYKAFLHIKDGVISKIEEKDHSEENYILPGFVDSHVHIESSMLVPSEFARLACVHGTVGTISDPHEIANVLGVAGVEYMIENASKVPLKIYFGVPSCVPATTFETAGASITSHDVEFLFEKYGLHYLAEMMNFPGVLLEDPEVMRKIKIAQYFNKPIDGHAPGLRGKQAEQYIAHGISTDHECFTAEEALDKLNLGMKILIREGSAAKNFEALIDLAKYHPDQMMFCSDDKHPDNLAEGHINVLVKRAIDHGVDLFDALRMASYNPVMHYNMNVGLLREGDPADFLVCEDLQTMIIKETYINGELVAKNGKTLIEPVSIDPINHFNISAIEANQLRIKSLGENLVVMVALDGQLITESITIQANLDENGFILPNIELDVLKIVNINRYFTAPPGIAFINNFGLKVGAIASSVGHDSHNILAVGTSDEWIAKAVNLIIENKGGISVCGPEFSECLPLPIGGLMSDRDGYEVAESYSSLDSLAKKLGSKLNSPFMTLSFMGLLVIPNLKISDKGLFDGKNFTFSPVSF